MKGDDPQAMMAAGAAALGRGDLAAAERDFAAAVAAAPGLADGWFNLGWVQRARRRFEPALESYARALAAGVAGPEEAHVNRAAILADHLLRTGEAIAEYERALDLAPGFAPALSGLAQLHEDRGEREAAGDCYRRLLRDRPDDGRATARLAMLALGGEEPGAVAARLAAALDRARLPEDRAELLFARAAALDAAGDYRAAFATLGEANRLAAALSLVRYDRHAVERLVERSIATFPAIEQAPLDKTAPVFVCGPFRSGSTLAEQLLTRHPELVAGGELEAIPAIAASLDPYPEAVPLLTDDSLNQLRATYAGEAARLVPAGARHSDKRCDNFWHLGLIARMFPGAPVVHTRRHPLDTLLSTLFLRFGDGVAYAHGIEDAVHQAIQHRRLMDHWRRVMPGQIHELDYDRLVRDPRSELEPALAFLGLGWDEAILSSQPPAEAVRTPSNWQVRQPLHARSSGRWRHHAEALEPARRLFAEVGIALD